ncbi:DUF2235 domain-containing protein [Microvirga massiliensis]|uniref:DUF2235 domain-containing protein n=1 Tax=Microvirga massiliensis TaxID=1033741 RepID=UPI000660A974|nr:DUF2235 domain-containing protein [Microvirga massiliensis]
MKRLVVCFDGTWNSADSEEAETNVTRLARAIHATQHRGDPQLVLYLRGVGSTGIAAQKLIEGATGLGVDDNIRSGYMFLAQNYVPGDGIFLFGFSRGAFTARSLAGFIGCCGLLKRQKLGDLTRAWKYYREEVDRTPQGFCASCGSDTHMDVEITFLGVWDTVGALGVPTAILGAFTRDNYTFHDTSPSRIVKHGCHALAIDEHRDEFVPTLWTGQVPAVIRIEQVWFAGAHSDVGGGYADRELADIPLVWMAGKASENGLAIDWSMLPDSNKLNPLAPRHDSRTGWSTKDMLTPTLRCVEGKPFQVAFYERLYAPVDTQGNLLPTINESVHESVRHRLGRNDLVTQGKEETIVGRYEPRNLGHVKANQ